MLRKINKSSTQTTQAVSRNEDGRYSVGTPELTPLRYKDKIIADCYI